MTETSKEACCGLCDEGVGGDVCDGGGGGGGREESSRRGGEGERDNGGESVGASLPPTLNSPIVTTPLLGRGREGLWLPVSHPGTCTPPRLRKVANEAE